MLPRSRAGRVLLAGFAVAAAVHLAIQLRDESVWTNLTQWLLMPLLAAALLAETRGHRMPLVRLTLLALGFSWLGDLVPDLVPGTASFLAIIGLFLLAQVLYIAAHWPYRHGSVLTRRRWVLLPYVVGMGALVAVCIGESGALLVPALLYAGCLVTMAVLATGVHRVCGIGGALFVVSDALIALSAFTSWYSLPGHRFWVMLTYVLAQGFIVAGVLARFEAHRTPTVALP